MEIHEVSVMQCKKSKYNILVDKNNDYVLLFNSNSGSLIELTVDEYDKFENNVFDDEIKKELIKQGFLISSAKNEYNQILFNETKLIYGFNDKLVFVIAPTLTCNMQCYYCFENKKDIAHTMSLETELEVIDFIERTINEHSQVKDVLISWFGGEPTLCFETIKRISSEIIKFTDEKGIKYSSMMITNGSLLDRTHALELVECKIRKIQITLDGEQEYYCHAKNVTPDIYQKVISNIRNICDLFKLTIRLNCASDNYDSLVSLLNEFKDCEKISFYLAPVKNHNHVFEDSFDSLVEETTFQQKREKLYALLPKGKIANDLDCGISPIGVSCGLLKSKNSVIGPDGELYYCEHDLGINERVIGDIWNGIYYNEYYMKKLQPVHLEKCSTCKIFPLCLTGCQSEVSQFERTKDYCSMKYTSLIKYLKKIYKKEVKL